MPIPIRYFQLDQTEHRGVKMDFYVIIKIACFCVLVASGETLNGIARTLFLNRHVSVKNAKKISILSALLLCLLICFFYVPTIGITTDKGLFLLGISLSSFMLLFDIVLGRFVMKARWSTIMDELNIFKGNLLGVGLIVMACCPLLSSVLRSSL
jgi:hypothetical protein